jgi:hypothetical protein
MINEDEVDEIPQWIAEALVSQVASPFNGVTNGLASALMQSGGVTKEDLEHIEAHVPELLEQLMHLLMDEAESFDPAKLQERVKASMTVMDLMFIGLMFAQYKDFFIQEQSPE